MKISFIVVGRNEGWKLLRCIKSLEETISFNNLKESEIIYVDSNSDDSSLEDLEKYKNVKSVLLIKDFNAAIARNIGAQLAKGNLLFFIDADMEIIKENFNQLFDENKNAKFPFISGDFKNYYYQNRTSQKVLQSEMYHQNENIVKSSTTGGLFMISREYWDLVGGMRDVFRRSQDMDLGLRLSKLNIFLYRLPIVLVNHHTVNYRSKTRLWDDLKDDTHLYARSLLYRKNVNNLNMYKLMLKQDMTLVLLLVSIFIYLFSFNPYIFIIYFMGILLRTMARKNASYAIYFILRDLKVLFGFFLFHPRNRVISFKVIES